MPRNPLRRRPLPPPPTAAAGGLRVASGQRIDTSDSRQIIAYRKRMAQTEWQGPAGVFNATVGEVGFGHDYVRDSLSRVRVVPAFLDDDPDSAPIPIDKDSAPKGLDPDLCDQLTQRLQPFPTFMGQAAQKVDIWGECFVALLEDAEQVTGETCRVFSYREIMTQGDRWRIRREPNDSEGLLLPAGTPFWRIWQPDPEFNDLPFSHMIRIMQTCSTLLNMEKLVHSFTLSRMATTGKLLAIADEFDLEVPANDFQVGTEDAGDGEGGSDTFFDDFMAAAAEAIADNQSASAVVNMIVRGPHDLIKDGIQVIDISRGMEEIMLKLRDEARGSIATSMNLPREIILGVGDTNHWNAEEIKEQAWLNHLEPRAYNILDATTTAYYRPALLANDVDPDLARRCVLWYDPTWFLGEPDRAESADFGYENYLLSGEAWRAAKNYSEDDAPSEEEIAFRVGIKQREQIRTTVREDDPNPVEPPKNEEDAVPPPEAVSPDAGPSVPNADVPETPDKTAPAEGKGAEGPKGAKKPPKKQAAAIALPAPGISRRVDDARAYALAAGLHIVETDRQVPAAELPDFPAAALTVAAASAEDRRLAKLGDRHIAIERDLRARLLQAADSTIGRALERAGLKVRGKLSARSAGQTGKALLAKVNGGPVGDIPATVGRDVVESFGLREEELLAGALGDLEGKYRMLVRRAQHEAARLAAKATSQDVDYDRLDEATEDDRDAGWALLAAGLTGLAATALYNPHPEAPAVGEFDETTLVPPGLIRSALDRAGGAREGDTATVRGAPIPQPEVPVEGDADLSGGATSGPTMLTEFQDQLGITADTYVWVYGDAPRKEFEPHLDLDGQTFTGWEDDVLANPGDFPDYDFLFPGDHNGCGCDAAIQYVQAEETETLDAGVGVDLPAPYTRTQTADALDAPRRSR